MCGIAGIFAYLDVAPAVDRAELARMNARMAPRGPDGSGDWFSADRRVGFAHRRLAIIDLSERGAQPMHSADGRLTITFNGEIYNYRELRAELEAQGLQLPHRLRHRGAAAALRRPRRRRWSTRCAACSPSRSGTRAARQLLLARDPLRHQAALLRRRRLDAPLRLAGQGAAGRRRGVARSRSGRHRRLPPVRQRARAVHACGAASAPCRPGRTLWSTPPARSAPRVYYDVAAVARPQRGRGAPGIGAATRARSSRRRCAIRCAITWWPTCRSACSCRPASIRARCSARMARARRARHLAPSRSPSPSSAGDRRRRGAARRRGRGALRRAPHRAHRRPRRVRARPAGASSTRWTMPTIDGINTWFVAKAAHEAGIKVALSGLGGDECFGGYPSLRRRAAQRRLAAARSAACPALGALARRAAVGRHRRRLARCIPRRPACCSTAAAGPAPICCAAASHAVGARRACSIPRWWRRAAPAGSRSAHRARSLQAPIRSAISTGVAALEIDAVHAQPAAARRRLGGHGALGRDPRALCRSVLPRRLAAGRRAGARQCEGRSGRRAAAAAAGCQSATGARQASSRRSAAGCARRRAGRAGRDVDFSAASRAWALRVWQSRLDRPRRRPDATMTARDPGSCRRLLRRARRHRALQPATSSRALAAAARRSSCCRGLATLTASSCRPASASGRPVFGRLRFSLDSLWIGLALSAGRRRVLRPCLHGAAGLACWPACSVRATGCRRMARTSGATAPSVRRARSRPPTR